MSVNDSFSDRLEIARAPGAATDTLCLSEASFWSPVHIVESAWLEHGPFAFWLIDQIRPRTFVELGTHNGFSYFCACQAVQRLGLATACYALDSWEGDDHAGFYGGDVYAGVAATNTAHYAGFSTLMRGLFSESVSYFPDGSVDLLHIDGRHGYEDVLEDYESWLPKLSDRAVVLFHDINVRERNFGVWQLWHRLREQHPSFEFLHSHGLGILAVGPDVPEGLQPLVFASSEERARIQANYARLGRAVSLQFQAHEQTTETRLLKEEIERGGDYARKLEASLGAAHKEQERIRDEAAQQEAAQAAARAALAQAEQQNAAREAVTRRVAAHVVALQAEQRLTAMRLQELEREAIRAAGLAQERDYLLGQLELIRGSSWWRATAPMRTLLDGRPRLRQLLRRSARLFWWTISLQLPARLRNRRRTPPPAALAGRPDDKAAYTAGALADLRQFLQSGERIVFPAVDAPDISIVIVLWNKAHLTLRCLRALAAESTPSRQIILYDNGSTDETAAMLSRVDGVTVIRDESNAGFLLGCNRGAASATGRAILLLNNDAFPRPDTLRHALATLDSAPDIGAVGARLVLPDGRLQEAGSLVWADGSCLGYERGAAPDAFPALFRRDVDYCSGAFLLTRRTLWDQLGGLDEAYVPAYYEETDYCLRLWEAGYRVVYEPAAVVDHFEFGSEAKGGDSVAAMQRNQQRFKERHASQLRQRHLPPEAANILAARTAAGRPQPRLLVLDNEVPLGAGGAGYPRAREILSAAVSAGWLVTLFPLHALEIDWAAAHAELPPEVEIVSQYAAPRLIEFMRERHGYYDVIIISRPENMALIRGFLASHPDMFEGARIIYDSEALAATREISKAKFYNMPVSDAEAGAMMAEELALADDVDAIVCVNEAEAEAFRSRGVPVHVLTHAIESAVAPPPWQDRSGFLFIGRLMERDSPNWLGLAWFIREVWPIIRKSVPNATLSVVGRLHPDHESLAAPGVRLQGPVADLTPLYDAARVFVAPVHFAAGVPLKVIEAGAAGMPVVGTRLMDEQLLWQAGVEIGSADTAEDFARACIALHNDESAWTAMQTAAQQRVRAEYAPEVFGARVRALLA